jgi:hypothetical protein
MMVIFYQHLPPYLSTPFSGDPYPFDQWSAMHQMNQSETYPTVQSNRIPSSLNQTPIYQPQMARMGSSFPTAQLNYLGHYMDQMPYRPTDYRGQMYQLQGLDPNYFRVHRENRPHFGFDPEYLLKLSREMRWRPQPDIMYPAGFFR